MLWCRCTLLLGDPPEHGAQGERHATHPDHGSRRARFSQLQRGLPRRCDQRGGGVHGCPDPGHRRSSLPGRSGRAEVPQRHSHPARGRGRRADSGQRRRRGGVRLLRPVVHRGDAPIGDRARCRRLVHLARPCGDDDRLHPPGGGRRRCSHRLRQEPDQPPCRATAARCGHASGLGAAPDAVRRPGGHARAALCDAGRHRRRTPRSRNARSTRSRCGRAW